MKGGTVPLILMLNLLLVAPWLCFASSDEALPPATTSENTNTVLHKCNPEVRLSTVGLSARRYKNFIADVRAALKKEGDEIHGIPVLRCNATLSERYLFVTLTNKAGYFITLLLDVTGTYFTAYSAGNYFCGIRKIISGFLVTCHYAPVTSSHVLMESSISKGSRRVDHLAVDIEGVTWGTTNLDEAISLLYKYAHGNATKHEVFYGVEVCIMMIVNAARFQYIERRMSAAIRHGNDVSKDPSLHNLALRWKDLSAAIEESHQGVFAAPITVRRRSNELLPVDNVRRAIPFIALMYCYCHKLPQEKQPLPWSMSSSQIPMLIRSVVQDSGDDSTCKKTEPTSRIVGPDGQCVDVHNGWYDNGNPVQLWPCKSNDDVNQLWTFKTDGTIRSNGKCLTSNGSTPGDYVMIYDCLLMMSDSPTSGVVREWEVRDDGTIVSKSGLVLSANSTASRTVLAVQTDDHSTGQSWTPTNDTKPFVTAIVGYNDLCLQADGEDVWLADCVSGNGKPEPLQAWALYPDGSIRPQQRQEGCLAPNAKDQLKLVQVIPCDPTSSGQRWVFRNDGSILNLGTKLVMDVRQSDPSLKQIIVHSATGNPNQNWAPML